MEITPTTLDPRLQKLVNLKVPGVDIMHGELKNLMYEAEAELRMAQEVEDETEEAMDSMERKYWEGYTDALGALYGLTYDLSFAIAAREAE
jgi:hypothetical protein